MMHKNTLLVAAYEALKEAQHTLSGLEAIIVGMEDDLNAVEAMGEKIAALQATVEGLEARIAAECKHSEKAWEEAWAWKEKAKYFSAILYDNEIRPPSVTSLLGEPKGEDDA